MLFAFYISLTAHEERYLNQQGFKSVFEEIGKIITPSEDTKRMLHSLSDGNLTNLEWENRAGKIEPRGLFHIFSLFCQVGTRKVLLSFSDLITHLKNLYFPRDPQEQPSSKERKIVSFYIRTIISMLENVEILDLTHFSKETVQEEYVSHHYAGFETLDEQDCKDIFESLSLLKNLKTLILHGNRIGDKSDYLIQLLFANISTIPQLSELNLTYCSLNKFNAQQLTFFAENIAQCKTLKILNLRGNDIEKLPKDMAATLASCLVACPMLEKINIKTDQWKTHTTIKEIQKACKKQNKDFTIHKVNSWIQDPNGSGHIHVQDNSWIEISRD